MWGITDYIYAWNNRDAQSAWCAGRPNKLDPEFDDYVDTLESIMFWGPIDLTDAVGARTTFQYYNNSQPLLDFFAWGGGLIDNNTLSFYELDRHSGQNVNNEWDQVSMNLDSLEGGTRSLLGESEAYVIFYFHSNVDGIVDQGAFVDEIIISWDDGLFDLEAGNVGMVAPDTVSQSVAYTGDSLRFSFNWVARRSSIGPTETPMFDITCEVDGSTLYEERMSVTFESDDEENFMISYSDLWVVTSGLHLVTWTLDVVDEITESYETNNEDAFTFQGYDSNVPPSIDFTRPIYGDITQSQTWITWEDFDPDDNAVINLYYDTDSVGFNGQFIPGAQGILEDSEIDSFLWDLSGLPDGEYWVFGSITDPYMTNWDYSDGPIVLGPQGLINPNPSAMVDEFRLETIYPNPFNSSTKIQFEIPTAEDVSVRVFDSIGRLRAEPFNGNLSAGAHEISWSPDGLSSGMYLIEVTAGGIQQRAKALYLK